LFGWRQRSLLGEAHMRDSVLWRCNFCEGPAWWTFINDEPFYSCKARCGGFMQNSLFDTGDIMIYKREGVSVSALTGEQAAAYAELRNRPDPRPEDPVPF